MDVSIETSMERLSTISVLPTPAPKIDEDGIAMLESWLDLLKSGEVVAIAICGLHPDRSFSNSYSGSSHDIIGAVVSLQARITKNL